MKKVEHPRRGGPGGQACLMVGPSGVSKVVVGWLPRRDIAYPGSRQTAVTAGTTYPLLRIVSVRWMLKVAVG